MTTSQFSDLTIDITKGLTKEEKKAYGIFISPQSIIASLYSTVVEHLKNDLGSTRRILEPSCGTCELVNFCDSKFTGIEIDGVEYNSKLYDSIKALKFKNNVNLYKEDFIKYKPDKLYDLVIGNPPYFVCKKRIFQVNIPNIYTEGLTYLGYLSFIPYH